MSEAAQEIDGHELLNCVATGNVSQVWEVRAPGSSETRAMKLLLPESLTNAEHKASLKHEATIGKSLDHPNLIKVYDLKIKKKFAYFTMEYFRAGNLKGMIRNELPAAQSRLKKMLECCAQALAHMHEKGWVHKDIKPDNILINKGSEVRIIDFSLATRAQGALAKVLGGSRIIQGTRTYIAPELIERRPTTPSVDIYSLGITTYEVLTGRPPFVHKNPRELLMAHVQQFADVPSSYNSNITPECDKFVLRLLAKRPKDRPADMNELFAEVRNLRFFKVDPEEDWKDRNEKAAAAQFTSLDARLDSRKDAVRVEQGIGKVTNKSTAKPKPAAERPATTPAQKPASTSQPVAQQPVVPQMPGYPPQMPGYAPMPGFAPFPGYPPGYAPMPPGYVPMPGYAMPLQPGQVPMQPGQMPVPGQVPMQFPQQPVPGVQQPAQPAAPAGQGNQEKKPATAPPKPVPVKPSAPKKEDDLPVMDELPDVF